MERSNRWPTHRIAWLLALALVSLACARPGVSPTSSAAPRHAGNGERRTPAPPGPLHYELDVLVDPARHDLVVTGTMTSATPVRAFFLNAGLALASLQADGVAVPFTREGDEVRFTVPAHHVAFRYAGRFSVPSGRDAKSHAWVDDGRVRLTEVTLWYPVLPMAGNRGSWPPQPATAHIRLPRLDGLTWVTSGQPREDGTFVVEPAGDLVIVGQPFSASRVEIPFVGRPPLAFDVYSPHGAALGAALGPILRSHAERLGVPGDATVAVAEFRADGANWLSFVSSGLVVFNSPSVRSFLDGELRGFQIAAHEVAHLWFGVALRAEGTSVRWLAESFPEYYAWLGVAEARGKRAADAFVEHAEKESAANPVRIDSLGFETDLVYTRGALAVAALAGAVTQERLDTAIRRLAERHDRWTVDALFGALAEAGAQAETVATYRQRWGI